MKNGFTLVELSIVLVVIGLLIGGILVGQSLISNVKIKNVIKSYEQHMISIHQFREKFRCLAGDCNIGFSRDGDGSGFLNVTYNEAHIVWEPGRMWLQLHEAGFLDTPYTGILGTPGTNRLTPGVNMPIIESADDLSDEAMLSFYRHTEFDGSGPFSNVFRMQIGTKNGLAFEDASAAAFHYDSALAIDSKYDDGLRSSGEIRVNGGLGGCGLGDDYYEIVNGQGDLGCALILGGNLDKLDYIR